MAGNGDDGGRGDDDDLVTVKLGQRWDRTREGARKKTERDRVRGRGRGVALNLKGAVGWVPLCHRWPGRLGWPPRSLPPPVAGGGGRWRWAGPGALLGGPSAE